MKNGFLFQSISVCVLAMMVSTVVLSPLWFAILAMLAFCLVGFAMDWWAARQQDRETKDRGR